MKLIFCISNLFVPATLTLIKNANDEQVLVYTDQKGIFEFFERLRFNNVIIYYRKNIFFSKNPVDLYRFFLKRNKVLAYLKEYNFEEIYFFHNAFGSFENWLIVRLSINCRIYHCPVIKSLPFKEKKSLKSFIGLISSRLIHNTEVKPLWTGKQYTYLLDNQFFRKIKSQKRKILIDNQYIIRIIGESFNLNNSHSTVLLTGGIVELGRVEEQEYIFKINSLIEALEKDRILSKPHPRFPNRYGLESELEMIPSFVPANVLLTKYKIFIGYSTTALTEAANNGFIAISLIDYLKPVSKEHKNSFKKYLINNLESGIIYFPKDIDSIILLLKENGYFIN